MRFLCVLTASSHTSHGPSQNICSKDCEISPAWACPVSQHTTTRGQTSSVPAEGTQAVVRHGTEHFALHWRLHGGMAWSSRSELVLAIRRGGHRRDWFAWCKDMYPHLLWPHRMSCTQDLSQCLGLGIWMPSHSSDTSRRALKASQKEVSNAGLAVDDCAGQQWWFNKKSLIPDKFNAQSRGWRKGDFYA